MEATPEGRAVAWFLVIVLGAVNAAGYAFGLHARLWWFDRVLHACAVLAATLWLALFVCRRVLRGGPGRGAPLALVIAGVGLAAGALWEVAEWGFDRIAPGDVIKGKHDTIIDIVMGTIGALLAGAASLKFPEPEEGDRPAAAAASPETP